MKHLAGIPIAPPGGFTGPGTGPFANPSVDAPGTLTKVISSTIGVMTAIAFIWFTIQFFTGAISWITAGSDKGKIEEAKKKLANNLIGLVIVISAIFLIELVGIIFGIPILNLSLLMDLITK